MVPLWYIARTQRMIEALRTASESWIERITGKPASPTGIMAAMKVWEILGLA